MIPKIIHYCWFGDESNQSLVVKKSIESWSKVLSPDYQIIRWDESNINFDDYPEIVKKLYDQKMYGFVPDIIRLKLLYDHGGIYLDTDMFLMKSFDEEFLSQEAFISAEKSMRISLGVIGSSKNSKVLKELYDFTVDSVKSSTKPPVSTFLTTSYLKKNYQMPPIKQVVKLDNGLVIYPREYFYPIPYDGSYKCKFTDNTVGAHLWNASWLPGDSEWSKKKDQIVFDAIKEYKLFEI